MGQCNGMQSAVQLGDLSINRSDQYLVDRVNGNTISHHFPGKHRVRNLLNGKNDAG